MAASVNVRVMEDGPRNCVLLVTGTNGAVSGVGGTDLAYQVLIPLSSLGYVYDECKQRAQGLRIDKVEWDINTEASLQVDLYWDTSTPPVVGTTVPALVSIGRKTDRFRDFGGLTPPVGLSGSTGTIGIATQGASATVSQAYSIILYLVKLLPNP